MQLLQLLANVDSVDRLRLLWFFVAIGYHWWWWNGEMIGSSGGGGGSSSSGTILEYTIQQRKRFDVWTKHRHVTRRSNY